MNRRGESSGLLARLVADPWRKLAAVVLAVGLWFWIDQRVSMSFELAPCRIALVDPTRDRPPGEAPREATIAIPLSPRDFAENGFFDVLGGDVPITEVRLEFAGARQLIRRIRPNEPISVELSGAVPRGEEAPEFEFTKNDLRFRDDEFETVLKAMHPERVRVRLVRKQEIDLVLAPEHVHLVMPPGDPTLEDRIIKHEMTFSVKTVKMRGTVTALKALNEQLRKLVEQSDRSAEALFDVDLSRWANTTKREIRQQIVMRPVWSTQHSIEMDPLAVDASIPVGPAFARFKLMVPVQLVTTRSQLRADYFEPIEPVEVNLSVANPLDAELQGLSEMKLREWARDNLCVLAVLDKDVSPDETPLLVGKLIFLKNPQQYREGIHYRVDENIAIYAKPKRP